jgi:hypothetical protein
VAWDFDVGPKFEEKVELMREEVWPLIGRWS